jgi:hypothetical protein
MFLRCSPTSTFSAFRSHTFCFRKLAMRGAPARAHPGTRRTQRTRDDVAVHAPESRSARCGDSGIGSAPIGEVGHYLPAHAAAWQHAGNEAGSVREVARNLSVFRPSHGVPAVAHAGRFASVSEGRSLSAKLPRDSHCRTSRSSPLRNTRRSEPVGRLRSTPFSFPGAPRPSPRSRDAR